MGSVEEWTRQKDGRGCLDVLLVRGGLVPALEPYEERFEPEDVALVWSMLEPFFSKYSLSIVAIALRCRSDDGNTEVTSAMVTFC